MTYPNKTILLFFDKINSSKEIASFKEIICDGSFKGDCLADNLIIIGTLNPYRMRRKSQLQLTKRKNDFDLQKSPLIYTVYALPPSMKYYVWDFGYLSPSDETNYIAAICGHYWDELSNDSSKHNKQQLYKYQSDFVSLIYKSQQKIREWYNEISMCSLRDVARANEFFVYFYKRFHSILAQKRILRAE
eukprot:186317_1